MLNIMLERLKQKHRTSKFPEETITLAAPFRGRPIINYTNCQKECITCQEICPSEAILKNQNDKLTIDLGRCLFCTKCQNACPQKAITFSQDFRLAVRKRSELYFTENEISLAKKVDQKILKLFGRSLKLRQVSAGGCNACEADTNVLGTLFFDLSRFNIQFVASPRHADGLLITGPVTQNMHAALIKTYEALPEPKIVIAVGACALSGGLYDKHNETLSGVEKLIPVDLFIPGCPPHPLTILDGLLRLLGKIE